MFRNYRHTVQTALAAFDRATVLRQLGAFQFRIAEAVTNSMIFGATGSGKSSGPGAYLALAYLAYGFGGLVLCAKPDEARQWQRWAAATGRSADLAIVDKSGKWRFNFMDAEASRSGEGGGLTINIVALLEEIGQAVAGAGKAGGDGSFWADSLRLLLTSAVDLCLFSGARVSLPAIRDIITSAPLSLEEVESEQWQQHSACWQAMARAHTRKHEMDAQELADFAETVTYFTREFPAISSRTRSIWLTMAAQLIRPFTTRPLRKIFCEDTNIRPEDCFAAKIIVIDLSVQEFRLTGRIAALAWKAAWQAAMLRRPPPPSGTNHRVCFLYADEFQNFVTERDAEFVAVCRSASACLTAISQNRESLRRVLGSDDTVDAFLGNMQCKWFTQNTGETNEYAARLLSERWQTIRHSGISYSGKGEGGGHTETSERRAYYVEPSHFNTLRKGGPSNAFEIDVIVTIGGILYDQYDPTTQRTEKVPYIQLALPQETL